VCIANKQNYFVHPANGCMTEATRETKQQRILEETAKFIETTKTGYSLVSMQVACNVPFG